MTNDQKADLRYYVRHCPDYSNEYLARAVGCTVATVKRYRVAIGARKSQ